MKVQAKGAVAFLKKKGPLGIPMGGWVILGALTLFLAYRYAKNRAGGGASSGSAGGAPTGAQEDAGLGADSGGGDSGSSSDQSQALEDLATALNNRGAGGYGYGYPFGQGFPDFVSPGEQVISPTTANKVNLPGAKVLNWANQNFKTQAAFNAYLKSKGLTLKQFQTQHPAAYKIYQNLAPGTPVTTKGAAKTSGATSGAAKSGTKKTATKTATATKKAVSKSPAPSKVYTAKPNVGPLRSTSTPAKVPAASKTAKTTTKPKPVATHPAPAAKRAAPPKKVAKRGI